MTEAEESPAISRPKMPTQQVLQPPETHAALPFSTDRAEWLSRHVLPHERWLRSHISRWHLPPDLEVDDLIQDCYAKLATMESVAQIRQPRPYLYATARNVFLMHLRRSQIVSIRAIGNSSQFDQLMDDVALEDQVADREQLRHLSTVIAKLPERSRQAFLLRIVDGLSHREIGSSLGISENAAQKSIAKSLVVLMKQIGEAEIRFPCI